MSFYCPYRELGKVSFESTGDHWITTRWRLNSKGWRWPWVPRVCSMCGGVKPCDILELLHEGWELGLTLYLGRQMEQTFLHPPGYRTRQEAVANLTHLLKAKGEDGKRALELAPSIWRPSPVVKVYNIHFSKEQLQRLAKYKGD